MTNNPLLPMYSTTRPIDQHQERLESICDQVRYLLMDWIEYQEKKGVNLTFQMYLNQWSELFTVVSEKMIERVSE